MKITMAMLQAIAKFLKDILQLINVTGMFQFLVKFWRKYPQDALFDEYRAELVRLCRVFNDDRANPRYTDALLVLSKDFDALSWGKLSPYKYNRAKINSVVTAVRGDYHDRATHLAAKLIENHNLGKKTKCWILNAVAHSEFLMALSIRDSLIKKKQGKSPALEKLRALETSHLANASNYLAQADLCDHRSILSIFNKAVWTLVMSDDQAQVNDAISSLLSIQPPGKLATSADLSWSENNYDSWMDMKERIMVKNPELSGQMADVEGRLYQNCDIARNIRESRAEEGENGFAKAMVAIGAVLALLVLLAITAYAMTDRKSVV